MFIGEMVEYEVPETQRAVTTVRHVDEAETTIEGSLLFRTATRFAGVISRVDGINQLADLHLFVPFSDRLVFVEGVPEGTGPGTWRQAAQAHIDG